MAVTPVGSPGRSPAIVHRGSKPGLNRRRSVAEAALDSMHHVPQQKELSLAAQGMLLLMDMNTMVEPLTTCRGSNALELMRQARRAHLLGQCFR
jgi:hypothetical protein